jgi:hypothetical protein
VSFHAPFQDGSLASAELFAAAHPSPPSQTKQNKTKQNKTERRPKAQNLLIKNRAVGRSFNTPV